MKFALLVDDTHGSLLGSNMHCRNVIRGLAQCLELRMEGVCSLNSSLCVELSRVRDLEEYILHNVRAIRALELEWFALLARYKRA